MRKYLLAAAAIAAVASPAAARDGSAYVGIEGGLLFPRDTNVDISSDDEPFDDAFRIDYKRGIDLDLIAGYDFGIIRAEAELGWKRAKIDGITIGEDDDEFDDDEFEVDDARTSVLSLMGNALLDLGGDRGFGAYVGGGLGRARVKLVDDKDSAWHGSSSPECARRSVPTSSLASSTGTSTLGGSSSRATKTI